MLLVHCLRFIQSVWECKGVKMSSVHYVCVGESRNKVTHSGTLLKEQIIIGHSLDYHDLESSL